MQPSVGTKPHVQIHSWSLGEADRGRIPNYASGVRLRSDGIMFYAIVLPVRPTFKSYVQPDQPGSFLDRAGSLYPTCQEFKYTTSSFPSVRELIRVIRRRFGKRVSVELRGEAKALAVKKVPR